MKRLCSLRRAIVLGFILTIAGVGYAHDPGLSTAELRFSRDELLATITFALRDIEVLVPIDMNHDGSVSSSELVAADGGLHMLAGDLLQLNVDGRPIAPLRVVAGLGSTDTLEFRLRFPRPVGARFGLHVPILSRLARGHRQYLTLRDEAGALLQHSLLDLDVPSGALAVSLLGFNLGVEAGQMAIVALLVPIAFMLRHGCVYQSWALKGGSTMVAFIAVGWIAERAFDVEILGF